jgi:hypothetical protein
MPSLSEIWPEHQATISRATYPVTRKKAKRSVLHDGLIHVLCIPVGANAGSATGNITRAGVIVLGFQTPLALIRFELHGSKKRRSHCSAQAQSPCNMFTLWRSGQNSMTTTTSGGSHAPFCLELLPRRDQDLQSLVSLCHV